MNKETVDYKTFRTIDDVVAETNNYYKPCKLCFKDG